MIKKFEAFNLRSMYRITYTITKGSKTGSNLLYYTESTDEATAKSEFMKEWDKEAESSEYKLNIKSMMKVPNNVHSRQKEADQKIIR
jgi:hypothetical protein